MFTQDLKDNYPFLTEYFEQGMKNPLRSISHSILFYGQDISAQYELAQEIARLLNCKELQNKDCKCLNCNWVREKQHPAVSTISKLDNKPSDDESKTVISIAQARMVKISLLNTSDYHRVFIFCDAKIEKDSEGNDLWTPLGLNETNFQEETANSLLKIIEEPPANTTFFFLTRDKSDLLETIISRSQSFFIPSFKEDGTDYSLIQDIWKDYPAIERKDSLDIAQKLFLLSKEQGSEKILNSIQNLFMAMLKSNIDNKELKPKLIKDIKYLEEAKQMIKNHVNPQLSIENMCLNIIK